MRAILQVASLPLIAFLLQSVVVAAIALVAGRLGAKRGPAYRVAVYRAGILSILALLIAGQAMRMVSKSWWEIRGTSGVVSAGEVNSLADSDRAKAALARVQAGKNDAAGSIQPADSVGSTKIGAAAAGSGVQTVATQEPSVSAPESLGALLLAGAVLLLGALAAGSVWVGGLRTAQPSPADDRLRSMLQKLCDRQRVPQVRLAISPHVGSAFVTGVATPTIYLPSNVEAHFTEDQIEAILCHELVHVRQGDCLWALLSRLCCAVTWVNPLSWVLSRKLTLASEEYCDQLVLGSGIEPATYAGCLLRVAETIMTRPAERLVGAGVFPAKSHLSKRISLMLNNKSPSSAAVSKKARLKIAAIFAVTALATCFIVSASPISAAKHDATPEATLNGFFEAFSNRNWKGFFSRIEGARVDDAAGAYERLVDSKTPIPKFTPHLSKVNISGDTATIHVSLDVADISSKTPSPQIEDDVTLHQVNGDWKIASGGSKTSFFNEIIEVSRDPKMIEMARSGAQRTVILSNFKQIALGIIMYIGDHNDKYALTQATLKNLMKPYIRNDKLWTGPDGRPLDVRFNPFLVGKTEMQIPDPATCVLISLGPRGNLQFINDTTPIAFADGHVKMVGRAAAAKLSWK